MATKTNSREQIAILQKSGWTPDLVLDTKELQLYNLKDPVKGDSLNLYSAWRRHRSRMKKSAPTPTTGEPQ